MAKGKNKNRRSQGKENASGQQKHNEGSSNKDLSEAETFPHQSVAPIGNSRTALSGDRSQTIPSGSYRINHSIQPEIFDIDIPNAIAKPISKTAAMIADPVLEWEQLGQTRLSVRLPGDEQTTNLSIPELFIKMDEWEKQQEMKSKAEQGESSDDEDLARLSSQAFKRWTTYLWSSDCHSDATITLTSHQNLFPPLMIPVHRAFIARSQLLDTVLDTTGPHQHMAIAAHACFGYPAVMASALRYFYGHTLMRKKDVSFFAQADVYLPFQYPNSTHPAGIDRAEQKAHVALAYAACGASLACPEILNQGLSLAIEMLEWDNLELCLKFCFASDEFGLDSDPESLLQGCFVSKGVFEYFAKTQRFLRNSPLLNDDASENDSVDSSDTIDEELSKEIRSGFEPRLLDGIVSFVVNNLPKDCGLNLEVYPTIMRDRFPVAGPGGAITALERHMPALQRLTFGAFMPEDCSSRESLIADCVSVVLLTLPFLYFRRIIHTLRDLGRVDFELVWFILEERNRRRELAMYELKGRGEVLKPNHRDYISLHSVEGLALTREPEEVDLRYDWNLYRKVLVPDS